MVSILHGLIFVTTFLLIGFGILAAHKRIIGPAQQSEGREFAAAVAFRIASVYSIILGLVFGSVNSQFADAQHNVEKQVLAMSKAYFLLDTLDKPAGTALKRELGALAIAEIEDIEQRLGSTENDKTAQEIYLRINRAGIDLANSKDLPNELTRGIMSQLREIGNLRAERNLSEWGRATQGFWIFFVLGFAAIAYCFGAYSMTFRRRIYAGLFFATVGMVGFITYHMSSPYASPMRVSAEPLKEFREFTGTVLID